MIVVTGATGRLGSQIIEHLLERIPAEQVGVSVRETAKAAGLAERGVRVRHGDFADPATLEAASQVLIVSVDALGELAVAQHRAAVDAAQRAGAQRILYTSHQAASPASLFEPARDHAATEAHLAASAAASTALRDGLPRRHGARPARARGRDRRAGRTRRRTGVVDHPRRPRRRRRGDPDRHRPTGPRGARAHRGPGADPGRRREDPLGPDRTHDPPRRGRGRGLRRRPDRPRRARERRADVPHPVPRRPSRGVRDHRPHPGGAARTPGHHRRRHPEAPGRKHPWTRPPPR